MSPFHYQTIKSEVDENGVRTIALNRPDRLNAMNRQLIDEVARAFDDANADTATRVIIFTGTGRAFCAGDDRREHVHPEGEAEARDLVDAIQRATRAIVLGAKPVVGAIKVFPEEFDHYIEHGESMVDTPMMREVNPEWTVGAKPSV